MNFCKKCHKPSLEVGLCDDCKKREAQSKILSAQKVLKSLEHDKYNNYLVYQGKTFTKELVNGIIWAPLSTNINIHHWSRLRDLKIGDRIFHCVNGKIEAISQVTECATVSPFPVDFSDVEQHSDAWFNEGLLVKCNYTRYYRPLELCYYRDKIKKLGQYKYSPFNKDGYGNQGYLFPLCNELAELFDKEMHK